LVRGDSTRAVDRRQAQKFLAKAQEFFESASGDLLNKRWNAAGLNAIHAGISAADAAVVASSGQRSSSKDHSAAVDLLTSAVPEAGASQLRQLTGLLGMKNAVEYEQRLMTESETRALVEQSGRLVRWAATVVSDHLGET
jgi:hypothetical protein